MGTSGFILKKREDVNIYQMIDEVKAAAGRAGLLSPIDPEFEDYSSSRGGVYVMGNIANTFEEVPGAEDMPIYIFSDGVDEHDWIVGGGRLINVLIFDFTSGCKRVLLDFLYEYFRSNSEDYFWLEGYEHRWYYTADDIARIKQREFHPDWCCWDPRLDEDSIRKLEKEKIKRKSAGMILRERGSAGIGRMIDEVKEAAVRAGLRHSISSEYRDYKYGGAYVTGNIADTFEEIPGAEDVQKEELAVSIYSAEQNLEICYGWVVTGCDLVNVVTFEQVGHSERILLDFLYEYLKRNPEDYFWCYNDWYFTLDDIARIRQKEFDPLWCYKYPTGQTFRLNN